MKKERGYRKRKAIYCLIWQKTGKMFFTLRDVTETLNCSYENAKVTVERLVKKKWVVRIVKGKYLIVPISISNVKVKVSDKEKTIIDCIDKPRYCGGIEESAKSIYFAKEEIGFEKIIKYAFRIGNNAVIKRLGFIAERDI